MKSFITRIELHAASSEEYSNLHNEMFKEGFSTTIKGSDGRTYHLLPGEYSISGDYYVRQIFDKAKSAANKTSKQSSVFVSEYSSVVFDGLVHIS